MPKGTNEALARLEAKVDALSEVCRLIVRRVPDNQELTALHEDLGRLAERARGDEHADSVRSEVTVETFERFRTDIMGLGRLR